MQQSGRDRQLLERQDVLTMLQITVFPYSCRLQLHLMYININTRLCASVQLNRTAGRPFNWARLTRRTTDRPTAGKQRSIHGRATGEGRRRRDWTQVQGL
eukprot:319174-Chlamydomonas_euryale.AAC.1